MAARARRAAALEAAAERQRLRAVEAVRPAVGPEVPLRIVLGYRLTDEKRQRVILVSVAWREAEEDVVLVAVAVAARVEIPPRVGLRRRKDPQLRHRRTNG